MQTVLFQDLESTWRYLDWNGENIEIVGGRFGFSLVQDADAVIFQLDRPEREKIFKIWEKSQHISLEIEKEQNSIAKCRGIIRDFPRSGRTMLFDEKGFVFGCPQFVGDILFGAIFVIFQQSSPGILRRDLHIALYRSTREEKKFLIFSYRGGIHSLTPYYFLALVVEPLERENPLLQYFIPELPIIQDANVCH